MNHRAPRRLVLIGNALSLMVAATRLAQGGNAVTIVNGSKNWGGHFTTVQCNGVSFDPGMVLHEFTSFSPKVENPDPRSYNPAVKNDCGRFCAVVQDYVGRYQQTHAIPTPGMFMGGRVHDDLLIANALPTLASLPQARTIENELKAIVGHGLSTPLHASRKHASAGFAQVDFESVSLANHGATLHATLIEPFCSKLLNVPTRDVVALYHRVAWLPLYYPESLLSYLRGTPQALPPTIFSYPQRECVGDLAGKLKAEIDASDLITVIGERPSRVTRNHEGTFGVGFAESPDMTADAIAWGNSPGDLLQALRGGGGAATYRRCSIALSFLRIATDALRRDFTTLAVVDPEYVIYRITNQTRCAGGEGPFSLLVAEINPDYALGKGVAGPDLGQRVAEELVALGIVATAGSIEILQTRQMTNALMVPDAGNMDLCAQEIAAIRATAGNVALLGPASGYFTSSFNDQVVQGLQLAATWSDRS